MNRNSPYRSEPYLVAALKRNDRLAYEYLYDHYASGLYGIICRIVKDEEQASDVLQDAFLKIWKNMGYYHHEKGSLFTWMLNVSRNVAIDALRANVKHEVVKKLELVREVELTPSSVSHSPVSTIGLRGFVEKLLPEKKEVIELVYFQGYTHEEASQILSLPLGTVKSRIRTALKEMKSIFEVPEIPLALAAQL